MAGFAAMVPNHRRRWTSSASLESVIVRDLDASSAASSKQQ
jgi:hypothetical protein